MIHIRVICLASVFLALGAVQASADCLQRFSCQLYGECRLPCLDELTGQPAPPTPGPAPVAEAADPSARPDATGKPIKVARKPKTQNKAQSNPQTARLAVVRVVSRNAVTSWDQLAGQPVSFGPEGRPAQAAARKMFARLGVRVEETPLDIDNALDGLASGDIAAVVVVGERDDAKLRALKTNDLHLLAVPAGIEPPDGMRAAVATPTTLPALSRGASIRTFAIAMKNPFGPTRHALASDEGTSAAPQVGRSVSETPAPSR